MIPTSTVAVLKMNFEKPKLKILVCRDYTKIFDERFRSFFYSFKIEKCLDCLFSNFHSAFITVLDKQAPLRKIHIGATQKDLWIRN